MSYPILLSVRCVVKKSLVWVTAAALRLFGAVAFADGANAPGTGGSVAATPPSMYVEIESWSCARS